MSTQSSVDSLPTSPYLGTDIDQTMFTGNSSSGVSEKVMLSAVVILVSVVVFMIVLHIYARWHIQRARRQSLLVRSRNTARGLVATSADPSRPSGQNQGLDPTVLKSLPVFEYSVETLKYPIDCAVCLSDFTDGESGRTLPKCKHSFHTDCIDMWFHSHTTCPLCRALVEMPENPTSVSEQESASTSSGSSVKISRSFNISVEVPRYNFESGFENNSGMGSSPAQIRSPVGRIISRILSRERRPPIPPATSSTGVCAEEIDLECGQGETAVELARWESHENTCQTEVHTASHHAVERV